MPNTLLTGVSGLSSHQQLIDVVGHNLANLNTVGFKSRRAAFSDVFYETIRSGSGAVSAGGVGTVGGSNPAQLGNGSQLSGISVNHSQGELDVTGAEFDFALDGEGFFVVQSENGPLYTRAGAFGVDSEGFLVDTASGYRVQRHGTVGEGLDAGLSFQSGGSSDILIPRGAAIQGQATSRIDLRGNFAPDANPEQTELLGSADPLTTGGGAATVTTTDLLNDLDVVTSDFQTGDAISVVGINHDGTALNATVNVDATTSIGAFLSQLSAALPDASASLGPDGRVQIESDVPGSSQLQVNFDVQAGSTGTANLSDAPFGLIALVNGAEPDTFSSSLEVHDTQGTAHAVGVELQKIEDGSWELRATIDPDVGVLTDSIISGITFNSDGSFDSILGTGINGTALEVQFNGADGPQRIEVDFGESGSLAGVTSIAGGTELTSFHDGLSTGVLNGVAIDESGLIEGVASNGRRVPLAEIAIATFRNQNGLTSEGNNFFSGTPASGAAEIGAARSGGRGGVLTGQLESSNVDIAVEFTRLIIAQRGFSANARTITVADEILEELTNIVR
ncbi:MAG: flagellar hook-basal body complex protein [Fuerstiella sp.]